MRFGRISKFLAVSVIALTGLTAACYKPAANTSEQYENDKAAGRDTADTSNEITSTENKSDETANIMNETSSTDAKKPSGFRNNLTQHIRRHGYQLTDVVDETNSVERRLLHEYGAVFLSKAVPPPKVMFTGEDEVSGFQAKAGISSVNLSGITVELQPEAARALLAASAEAKSAGLSITPRDREDSGRRSFAHTAALWNGRVENGCDHWLKKGRLSPEKVAGLKRLPVKQQVAEVLKLENQGIYFSTNFDKSILYSVAAPGTSQHLSMLAFDAKEFGNKKIREIMARHGWFRTVQSDAPHFTYLGYQEADLPSLGLKEVSSGDGEFWIPNV